MITIWYRGLGSIFEIDGQAVVTVKAGRQESFEYNEEYKLLYQNIVFSKIDIFEKISVCNISAN
jgi:predicted 3-demethylubiquinone-9 3-methyltransferase (glyoxalase superfamily)